MSASSLDRTHRARKRFGQNFLVDQGIIQQIVNSINPQPDDALVEIGPGQGAITAPLLAAAKKLSVVEIDRDLIAILTEKFHHQGLTIHEGDALNFDFPALAEKLGKPSLRVVGNLPYNISTPLLFHLLGQKTAIQDMHFMLQKRGGRPASRRTRSKKLWPAEHHDPVPLPGNAAVYCAAPRL